MIIIITDVVYFIQISNTGKDDSITPPDSPSTPMRVEMNLKDIASFIQSRINNYNSKVLVIPHIYGLQLRPGISEHSKM